MGKYNSLRDSELWQDNPHSAFLEAIANELAEANKLKRLQIRVNIHTSSVDLDLRKSFLSELEDQA